MERELRPIELDYLAMVLEDYLKDNQTDKNTDNKEDNNEN